MSNRQTDLFETDLRPEGRGAPRPRAAEPSWRQEPVAPRRLFRRIQIGSAWFAMVVLTAMLAWASTWLQPPKPACLVLIGAGYQENLAIGHNCYGWQSLKDLAELAQDRSALAVWETNLLNLPREPLELRTDTAWYKSLQHFDEKTLVLSMALHGGADERGAYLLPNDADPQDNQKSRLRLTEVLDRLAELPAEKNKLLFLDATQISANWQLGMLHNDFARQLNLLDSRIAEIPNLVVIGSSNVEQRSWVCQQWRQTVFAHFVIEGFKGAARDRRNDGRIDVWDLYRFTRDSVATWVRANRGAEQTPVLLPSGDLGRQRAGSIDLIPPRDDYRPPDPLGTPVFAPPAELVETWQTYQRLAEQVPLPYVYTPHVWRRYQATLLRYEQLLVAGDDHHAVKLYKRLQGQERHIQRVRHLELGSSQTSLAMMAAAGVVAAPEGSADEPQFPPVRKLALQALNTLWNALPAEYGKCWARLQGTAGTDPLSVQLLRLHLYELLLERAAEAPCDNLDKSYQILHALDDPLHCWPVQVHSLIMFHRELPSNVSKEGYFQMVQLALRVRCLAEQTGLVAQPGTHPYSEQVSGWIRAEIDEADGKRRLGEDLVFSDSQNWPQARDHLEEAKQGYQRAHDLAEIVSLALNTRDRVLAMLPHYSHWAARRIADRDDQRQTDEALLGDMETLWQDTHQLVCLLENPNPEWIDRAPPPAAGDSPARGLVQQTQVVRRAFAELEDSLARRWVALADANIDSPGVWRDIDDALAVPSRDGHLRRKLLLKGLRASRQLLVKTSRQAVGYSAVSPLQTFRAKTTARGQGRMALAVLGRGWFDQCKVDKLETYEQVRHRIDVFAVEEHWEASLTAAGDQIQQRWRQMPVTIKASVATSRTADRRQAHELLQTADRLVRQVDGPASVVLVDDPADAYRRLLLQDLLLWQTERTFNDHWFAEDPDAQPYYRVAGLAFLGDAESLGPHTKIIQEWRAKLDRPGKLVLNVPPRLDLTSEQRVSVACRLEPAKGAFVPPGFPVVWVEPGKLLRLVDPAAGKRLLQQVGKDRPGNSITCTIGSPVLDEAEANMPAAPGVKETTLALKCLYRGQRINATLPVNLHLVADTVVCRYPLPQRGSVAVRAAPEMHQRFGDGNGAVAIVLDCTGSMGPPKGQPFTDATKFAEATRALRQVVRKLPRNTTVSVWAFGQAVGPEKTVKDAESTIRRVQDPVQWNPADPDQLDDVLSKVEYPALEPWNESPIVRAMLSAKEDLAGAPGFKTILVLTDGMDNRFADDAALNPKKQDIPTVLRTEFQGSGIELNIVGFKVSSREETQAWKQFQVVETLFPPGTFRTVSESQTLATALETALRQRLRYWVEQYDSRPVAEMPSAGLEVSRSGANDQWFSDGLSLGSYIVRGHTGRALEKPIALGRGDLLLMRLAATPTGAEFQRALFSLEDYPWKPSQEKSGWRMAVLQNQRTHQQDLQMLVTLEKTRDGRESRLQQIKPRESWFEVRPSKGTPEPYALRWGYQTGYPAPAWSLNVSDWPLAPAAKIPSRPVLQVWWNPDQQAPSGATLKRDHDFKTLAELTGRRVRVFGDQVCIESVHVERHVVETEPGVREPQSCLVVRLDHLPEKPVWARVAGLKPLGEEHRFYKDIGKYSGLFWPIAHDEADEAISGLSVVSLDEFKRDAQRRGFVLEMDRLPVPVPNDFRPRPPLELQ